MRTTMTTDMSEVWEDIIEIAGGTIIYLILDGVGGLPDTAKGGTELQMAQTPNLDRLAKVSACGLLEVVGPGITPGSGPGHLALFGYDPLKYKLGRGVLAAAGIDFKMAVGDMAARINFATLDHEGNIVDRRAGRIDTDTNRRLCKKIRDKVKLNFDGQFFIETVSEHRALLVLRGPNLLGNLRDTDPQKTGVAPMEPEPTTEGSEMASRVVSSFILQAKEVLSDEKKANMILLRGFDNYDPLPSLRKRFALKGICIAQYPMYRGISRLLGMEVASPSESMEASFEAMKDLYGTGHDFYFLHLKKTDSSGEDGNFELKVKTLEEIDRLIPMVADLNPDVLVVTADHSTPAVMRAHSWHPVPVMIRAEFARVDRVEHFNEYACASGSLGMRPGVHLMGLALAHAGRLKKYGA